ncbi:hemoglobin [Cupriavidus sp. YR651]|uniref:group III truncated hemoglobin n=1 Tax=Cupriavidus sp. YR651 TaxID=1855315 RepID=UPI000887438B|nr:group III truncated hemoglobin [Cupriavidus sp. YR651]SDC54798.1 hemoglobin [Cupriavidus sp. YR651]
MTEQAEFLSLPSEEAIAAFVQRFYANVRADGDIGPLFEKKIAGAWDVHLDKMNDFWSSIVLGSKRYRGHVLAKHLTLSGIEGPHFARWIEIFIATAHATFDDAVATEFVRPALRIASSLQLGMFGWDYEIPAAQHALLESYTAPRRS